MRACLNGQNKFRLGKIILIDINRLLQGLWKFLLGLAHTDAQVKRVIDAIEELGCFDNTLVVYLTGDNGASAEEQFTVLGVPSFQNGTHEDPEWLLSISKILEQSVVKIISMWVGLGLWTPPFSG